MPFNILNPLSVLIMGLSYVSGIPKRELQATPLIQQKRWLALLNLLKQLLLQSSLTLGGHCWTITGVLSLRGDLGTTATLLSSWGIEW